MIKVGILSMQRIANYGSFLQAYGLMHMLKELGCDVQFVDYHPGKTLIPTYGGTGFKRKMLKVIDTLMCGAPLQEKIRFIRYKKNYAVNYFPYLGINDRRNYSPELDLLIIGSDEVFNCVQKNPNVGFSPELFGDGNNARRVVTYAASFGNTTKEILIKYKLVDKVGEWLKKFDAISVRDYNSGKIVQSISGVTPEYHLDPVLAYDFVGKCSDISISVPKYKYMILYGYSGRFAKEECQEIWRYAKNRNLKIFCIGGVQNCCDKFIYSNPFQIIAYFQHAECVVTDTFHGTILSVITHKQFVSIVRMSGYGNFEKMADLLGRLDLSNRIVSCIQEFPDMLRKPIDYKAVNKIIDKERKKSYQYLERQIRA